MFGHRHGGEGHWAAGGRRWRRHFGGGFGGRHGMGGDMMRAGRMLAQGDLRLIALALIAEQPRHGYEIIKLLEDRTEGWYSPSPGIVYPTLTYLEEAGYVTAQAEGAKKLYTITDEGRAYLEQNRDFVDAVLERLSTIGEKVKRMREHFSREEEHDDRGRRGRRHRRGRDRGDDEERDSVPPLVRAALENLHDVAEQVIEGDAESEAKVVEVLARAAQDLKRKN
ncbi:MAG: PadR family transcriptional regulator [Alphaproteobacteria bacterium]